MFGPGHGRHLRHVYGPDTGVFEAAPFDWTFTRNDLNQVLAKIADREPDLRLAA